MLAQEDLAHMMAPAARLTHLLKGSRAPIPIFLCPVFVSYGDLVHDPRRRGVRIQKRPLHVETAATHVHELPTPSQLLELPRSCPGCGAFTQILSPTQPGFYSTNRKSVKAFIARHGQASEGNQLGEAEIFQRVLASTDTALLSHMGLATAEPLTQGTIYSSWVSLTD